jgi:hypothetical protein
VVVVGFAIEVGRERGSFVADEAAAQIAEAGRR